MILLYTLTLIINIIIIVVRHGLIYPSLNSPFIASQLLELQMCRSVLHACRPLLYGARDQTRGLCAYLASALATELQSQHFI